MTFFEAALHVLEKEGKPLTFKFITERAIGDKLLSHVGKDPEATMYYRLAAMAKRKGDRRVVATEPGSFGLLDWGVVEDPHALDVNPLPQPNEEDLPLRPRERHPVPRNENVRMAGRGERHKRHEERDRKKRLQPLPDLVFELLSQAQTPMSAVDIAASLRDAEKVSEDLGAEALLNALKEDNRRREGQNRRALFVLAESGEISIDRAGAPGEGIPVNLQAALAQSLGMQLEGATNAPPKPGPGLQRLLQQIREHAKNMGRVLRRRFGEAELGALEVVGIALLEAHGFREIRATKRAKEGLVLTARRREGLLDVRYAAKLIKGPREISKLDVSDFRRELVNHSAHVGILIGAGEVARDARTEALGGGALLLLWSGEALAEKLTEKKVGAHAITMELPDVDDGFWRRARDRGDIDDRRREERRKEREERELKEKPERELREAARAAENPPVEAQAPAAEGATPASARELGEAAEASIQVRVDLSQPQEPISVEALAASLSGQEPPVQPTAENAPDADAKKDPA